MTFKAVTANEMNYKFSSLNFFRINDNELINAFREKYPIFVVVYKTGADGGI